MVALQSDVISVRVLNPTHRCLNIKAGTQLANCENVVSVTTTGESALQSKGMSEREEVSVPPPVVADHLQDIYERSKEWLNQEQEEQLKHLLNDFQDVFAKGSSDLERTKLTTHKNNKGTADHIRQAPRRLPLHTREDARTAVQEMIHQGIVEQSQSPWVSPIVLVRKKDGSTRFCVDYRKLNAVTKKDSYPLPRTDTTLDAFGGSTWFSTLDLKSGYW